MTEWIFNLKTKLTVLVMMLCSLCVTKVYAVEPSLNVSLPLVRILILKT